MRLRSIPQTLLLLATAACTLGPAASSAPYRSGSRTVLTGDEMRAAQVTNLLDAVERLRPEFMRARVMTAQSVLRPQRPGVFHNGVFLGGLDMLRTFSALEVVAVRRLSASDVTLRYGSRYGGMEALEIVTVGTGRVHGR